MANAKPAGTFIGSIAALLLAGCATSVRVEHHAVPGNANLPFAEAVRVGDMLYLSGQIGTRPAATGLGVELVPGGIAAETRQAMDNIRTVLERHGASMDNVVKCTVMLADMAEWAAMNAVYVTYFPRNLPARSALGANGLALNARIEIECLAAL